MDFGLDFGFPKMNLLKNNFGVLGMNNFSNEINNTSESISIQSALDKDGKPVKIIKAKFTKVFDELNKVEVVLDTTEAPVAADKVEEMIADARKAFKEQVEAKKAEIEAAKPVEAIEATKETVEKKEQLAIEAPKEETKEKKEKKSKAAKKDTKKAKAPKVKAPKVKAPKVAESSPAA